MTDHLDSKTPKNEAEIPDDLKTRAQDELHIQEEWLSILRGEIPSIISVPGLTTEVGEDGEDIIPQIQTLHARSKEISRELKSLLDGTVSPEITDVKADIESKIAELQRIRSDIEAEYVKLLGGDKKKLSEWMKVLFQKKMEREEREKIEMLREYEGRRQALRSILDTV